MSVARLMWWTQKGKKMKTKYDIGQVVPIKLKVIGISIGYDGTIEYDLAPTNSSGNVFDDCLTITEGELDE